METLELHLAILQRVAFSILKTARFVQNLVSSIYWYMIVNPIVFVTWKILGEPDDKSRTITFYQDKFLQYRFAFLLKYLITFNGSLNGIKMPYSAYEFLLRWNPSIPLIGLKHKKTTYIIHWLGKKGAGISAEGYPLIDIGFLGTSTIAGHFRIISKEMDPNKNWVEITCLWLSGEHKGEEFKVGQLGLVRKGGDKPKFPDSIYFPPKIIVWLFEIIISVAALLAFVGAIHKLWEFVDPYAYAPYDYFKSAYLFILSFLQNHLL